MTKQELQETQKQIELLRIKEQQLKNKCWLDAKKQGWFIMLKEKI